MERPDWDDYFLGFARAASRRGTCDRKQVGAVVVAGRQVVATGYNGSVRGLPHCDDVGHDMVGGHCVRTIHAEMNALAQAARRGVAVDGAAIYTTASPCWACFRVLVNAGIRRFVFAEPYREGEHRDRILEVAGRLGLVIVHRGSPVRDGRPGLARPDEPIGATPRTGPKPPSATDATG